MYSFNNSLVLRTKREMTVAERKENCKNLEYGSNVADFVSNVADDVSSIPIIGEVVGVFTAGVSIVSHIAKAGLDIASTALECDEVPFDEIKEIMDERFNEVDRQLYENSEALENISDMVSKTFSIIDRSRIEMREGFKEILKTLKSKEIIDVVSKINNFVHYFESEKSRLRGLPQDELIFRLQGPNNILAYLRDSRTPKGDSLQSALYEIIEENNNYAIPEDELDLEAFQALYALFYGTQMYASIMFFLLEQHSYLADYHHLKGNTKEFNSQLDIMKLILDDFKFSLAGSFKEESLIDKVINIMDEVKNKDFIEDVDNGIFEEILRREETLEDLKIKIKEIELPLINDTPETAVHISFIPAVIQTPFGDWEERAKVRYAVQLKKNGIYSKFSDWSDPFTVQGKANPTLKFPVDPKRRKRLIYRKINDDKPQLVGIMSETQTDFKDINRDLFNAAGRIDKEIGLREVNKLLDNGADINAVFEYKRTVLHAAAKSGNDKIASILLERNFSDVNIKDKKGYSPLHVAAEAGHSNLIQFLLKNGANVNLKTDSSQLTPLHIASKQGFVNTVKTLMESDVINVNEKDKTGFTALHHATLGGPDVIRTLVENTKVNVNAKSESGLTPLHLAIINDDRAVTKSLLENNNINLNAGNNEDMTPLHFASMSGNSKMVNFLIEADDTDANAIATENNWTPLHFAIYFKKEDTALELLKGKFINVNLLAKGNITPLHLSVAKGQFGIMEALLEEDADIEAKTDEGFTPLHLAAMRSDSEATEILINKGADTEARSNDGSTPLHLTIISERIDNFYALLNEEANTNAKMLDDSSPLHLATSSNQDDMVSALLNKGANLNALNNEGKTPVHLAISNYNLNIIKEFISHDPNLLNSETDEYSNHINLIYDVLKKDIFNYLINKDSEEYEDFEDMLPFEIFDKQGKFDLLKIFINDPMQENQIQMLFLAFLSLMKTCVDNLPDSQRKSTYANKCVPSYRFRRDFVHNSQPDDFIPLKMRYLTEKKYHHLNVNNLDSTNNVKRIENIHVKSSEQLRNSNGFSLQDTGSTRNVNANSFLLLLDFFIRRLTKVKHKPILKASVSDFKVRSMALKMIEKFDNNHK